MSGNPVRAPRPWRASGDRPPLFPTAATVAPLPPVTAFEAVVAGIDVGGVRKGFHAVALRGGRVLGTLKDTDPAAIARFCTTLGAVAVGVDAPCRWGTQGARSAERALQALGVRIFPTPTYAVATRKPFFHWMLNGADLYRALGASHRLHDDSERPPAYCFETFPHAVACALAGRLLRASDKRRDRRALLARCGVDLAALTNIDLVDAALCAVAAAYVNADCGHGYGRPDEGLIFVPAAPLAPG